MPSERFDESLSERTDARAEVERTGISLPDPRRAPGRDQKEATGRSTVHREPPSYADEV
jgi:hypothetical protein